ncbi:hypothetical protein QQP08_020436 [Theobroma cacao]|nr:hypothetical protein QQP08_020436 [Theobroma cacao]
MLTHASKYLSQVISQSLKLIPIPARLEGDFLKSFRYHGALNYQYPQEALLDTERGDTSCNRIRAY